MQKLTAFLPFLLFAILIGWNIEQAAEVRTIKKDIHTAQINLDTVQRQQEALRNEFQVRQFHLQQEQEFILVETSMRNVDITIPLTPEIQIHLQEQCKKFNVPYHIMLAIIEHESRFVWQPPSVDSNGLESVGYTQINYPHWERLKTDYDVDVTSEYGNITGGVIILSELLEDYPLEKALVSYQCGVEGAKDIESTEFSRFILQRSKEFEQNQEV